MALFKALRHRRFALRWAGQGLSRLGDFVYEIALVPNEQLGRVASIDSLGSFGLLPVGMALAGWATERVGPPAVFIIGGLFTALISLAALAHPAIRRLD